MIPYIIGETAYNHEGDFDYLLKMIEEIGEIGVQAIKYHLLFDMSSYMVENHPLSKTIENWMFSKEQWIEAFRIAQARGLDIVALCDDQESLEFINTTFPDLFAVELHAVSLNDYHMLKEAAQFPGKVILGIGGSTLDEIHYAIELLKNEGKDDILLMYGFQNYPTNYAEINLKKMLKIQEFFDLPVGYADHTAYDDPNNVFISCMGAMMGIPILEKHYTPDYGIERIDYHAAVGWDQMKKIKELMALSLQVVGDGSPEMSAAEKKYGNTGPMKKAIVAAHDIQKGKIIAPEDIAFKRTETESPIKQMDFSKFIGLKTLHPLKKDDSITFSDVEYIFETSSAEDFTNIKR
ncbi:N-acetylneuraminate synthase [Methanocalculus chunghsingensis]|uniref:N-acetylneuraminate synthase n=1 Tax=Methanocalculus chunghsingensis TaxID=156457 RepID=A0A8J8B607_9EURY|nr:N-acetylneuraminate synthase family protein [Methanocalculus chunghsingensis]MBR1368142.1 N-acetylneuraminate synthase [Methanocalculus chunghsingensis]